MIISKTVTILKQHYIQHQKNRKGNAWIGGMWFLMFILIIFLLLINKMKMEETVETVEDALTTSALGGLNWDNRAIALTHDYIIDDEEKCYETVCTLIGKNLGLNRVTKNTFNGNKVLFTNGEESIITKLILYDVYSDGHITSYEFNYINNGLYDSYNKTVSSMNQTPQGENIITTSIYVEYEFPIRICGFEKRVKKAEYVSIENL